MNIGAGISIGLGVGKNLFKKIFLKNFTSFCTKNNITIFQDSQKIDLSNFISSLYKNF